MFVKVKSSVMVVHRDYFCNTNLVVFFFNFIATYIFLDYEQRVYCSITRKKSNILSQNSVKKVRLIMRA